MQWNGLPLVIFGTSGASKEVRYIINDINKNSYVNQFNFLGYVGENKKDKNNIVGKDFVITSDEEFEGYISQFPLIGVVIPIGNPIIKKNIYEKIKRNKNIVYPNIVSPKANIIDEDIFLMNKGNIIAPGAVINIDINLGDFNLINVNSTIGHDCIIGDFCVINPLAAISGNVILEDLVLVGAGAAIKQGLILKRKSTVGLGAFLVKDTCENQVLICNSAIDIKEKI